VEGLLDRRFNEEMIAAGVMVDGAGQFVEPDDFKDIA
jgi:hypothetical protein